MFPILSEHNNVWISFVDEDQKDIGLDSNAQNLVVGQTVLRSTVIDSTLRANTKFIFDYSGTSLVFSVASPLGKVYDNKSPEVNCNTHYGICRLFLDGMAEVYFKI